MLESVALPSQLIREHPGHAGYEAKNSKSDAYCDPQSMLLGPSPGLEIVLVFRPLGRCSNDTKLAYHPVLRGPMVAAWAGILGDSLG